MLREFYKLGATYAFQKRAIVGGLLRTAPGAVAKSFARKKLIGEAKGEMREMLGLETPEWQRGSFLDIPELVAVRAQEEIGRASPESEPTSLPATNIEPETKPKTEKLRELKLPKPRLPRLKR